MKPDVTDSIVYQLLNSSRLLKAHMKEEIQQQNPNRPSVPYALMAQLAISPASINELAQHLGCSKQEASRLVQHVKKNDWVEVSSSEQDKRQKIVSLSDEGQRLLKQGAELFMRLDQIIESDMGKQQLNQLKQALSIFDKTVAKHSAQDHNSTL